MEVLRQTEGSTGAEDMSRRCPACGLRLYYNRTCPNCWPEREQESEHRDRRD